MDIYSKYIILSTDPISSALKRLNSFKAEDSLTLFIADEQGAIVGTLTDGDIRRNLVEGITIEDPIGLIAHKSFVFLRENGYDVNIIRLSKEGGISLLPVLDNDNRLVYVVNLKKQKSCLPIDVVLMAGGKGERLRPLTEDTPKPLLKVGGKCIIDYNVDRLIDYGVRHFSVTVNYLKEQLEAHFAESRNGISIKTVREPKFLGTMGSIQFVDKFYNDTILLMNSDLFTNIDYEDFFLHFKKNDADMSIAAVPYTVSVPYGIFELDGHNVKGILEKPTYNYYANSGIYLIKREFLNLIPKDTFFNATDFMNILMEKGYKVIRFPLNGTWIDIGSLQEYQKANELAKYIR